MMRWMFIAGLLSADIAYAVWSIAHPAPVDLHVDCVMHGRHLSESARLPVIDFVTCGNETILVKVSR